MEIQLESKRSNLVATREDERSKILVTIRKLRTQDLAAIQRVMQQIFEWYKPNNLVEFYQYFLTKIPNRIKWFLLEHARDALYTDRYDLSVFVAETHGKVVGVAIFRYVGQKIYAITSLGVDQSYQGRGIGSKLIKKIISWVWQRGGQKITLRTDMRNTRVRKLYRRFGFTETCAFQHMALERTRF